ncbi:amidohydrolase family protein [Microtetraspora malaysiensis]|uniref:amidohydrolase family protein n=1 Tax=Microtetraspora malaysiensis TaxID=161358 RepID=UPI003D8F0751
MTFTEGTNIAVALDRTSGRIVLDMQGILWSLAADGGDAVALTTPDLDASRPDWSPDGRHLVFQAYKTGQFHIWSMAPDGSELRQLTEGPFDHREPAWSPDGTVITFASDRAGEGSYDIWTIDVITGRLSRRTTGPTDDYAPAWHPDGKIVFVRGRVNLATVDEQGKTEVVRTVSAPSRIERPTVSPGGRIAYQVYAQGALYVDGEQVTEGEDVFLSPVRWMSEDELMYTADGKIRVRRLSTKAVRVVPFAATLMVPKATSLRRKERSVSVNGIQHALGIMSPRVSPDGQAVVFVALNKLWLAREGKPQLLVDSDPGYVLRSPNWAHEGKSVTYSSDRDGLFAVYRYDLSTGRSVRLTSLKGAQYDAVISPDGRNLAFQDEEHAIRVLDLQSGKDRVVAVPLAGPERVGPPSWSPDSRLIAYNDRNTINSRFREGYNQIKVVDIATGSYISYPAAPHLSLSDRSECGPAWSPDGRWMAVIMESALWALPVDPAGRAVGQARQLTEETADAPSWAADSQSIVYLSNGNLRRITLRDTHPKSINVPLHWRHEIPGGRTRIRAGQVWDGASDTVRDNIDIIVEGNRIVALENRARTTGSKERLIDARDKTVIPGLWESHNHPTDFPESGGRYFGAFMAYGVTGNVSVGSFGYEGLNQRESLLAGSMVGPRHFFGELLDGSRTSHPSNRVHATTEGLRRTLHRVESLRYDYVKTYVRTSFDMMQEASSFGHDRLGVPSGTHLLAPGTMAGLDMITHLSATQRLEFSYSQSVTGRVYEDVKLLLTQGGMGVIVTPFAARALIGDDPSIPLDPRVAKLMPPWFADRIRNEGPPTANSLSDLQREIEIYVELVRRGATLLAGTDTPLTPPGLMLHMVLRAMVRFGMSPFEALRTATVLPAKMMGVGDELGMIKPGYVADLTFIDGDPFTDFSDLISTTEVMKNGIIHTQNDLVAPFA